MRLLRDAMVVAGYELGDALRSRRVLVFALIYVGGSVAGALAFINVLESLEAGLAEALAVARPDAPGAMTEALMQSPEFLRILSRLVRDRDLAEALVGLPPLALFYGWLALSFAPAMVVLTASETVAADLASGAARFCLVRTDRLAFSLGKLLGQTAMMTVAIASGAVAVWVTGWFELASFAGLPTATWLVFLSGRASVYAFSFVGLAVGTSHLTRSIPVSRALGLLALGLISAIYGLSQAEALRGEWSYALDSLVQLLPRAHQLSLWQPAFTSRAPAMTMLLVLGLCYFAAGFGFRNRRDV